MVSILSKLALFLLLCSCVQEEYKKTYIDGDDLIPPEPSWVYYFTMHGNDSDDDGVRDDVELWINEKMVDRNLRVASKKIAQTYGEMLKNTYDSKRFLGLVEEENVRNSCFKFITFPYGMSKGRYLKSQLKNKILNNYWRKMLLSKGYSHKPSGSYRIADVELYEYGLGCRFKIDNIWSIIEKLLEKYPNYKFTEDDREKVKDMYEINPDKYDPLVILGDRRREF